MIDSVTWPVVSSPDRLPPHSPEAEQGVLGCALLDPGACMGEIIERFRGHADIMYDLRHGAILAAMVAMFDASNVIDLITLQQWLRDKGLLEQIGGIGYLVTLSDAVPSAANLSYYADIVWDKFVLRRTLAVSNDAAARVYAHEGQVGDLMDEIERDLLAVADLRTGSGETLIKDFTRQAIDLIEFKYENAGKIVGVPTGLVDLDGKLGGLRDGEVTIIAGRPSVGKTSLAMCIAEHAAINCGLPVAVFSLEMLGGSLVERMLYSRCRLNARKVMSKEDGLTQGDFQRLTAQAAAIAKAPLHVIDDPGLSILGMKAKARRLKQRHGVKLFVIDYLQLVATTKRTSSREQEIADISRNVKKMALELKTPVILLSQLNREVEKDGRKPRLSDLRESGSIEQDADTVILLHPDVDPKRDPNDNSPFSVIAIVAKQRNGPRGEVPLMFFPEFTRYESQCRIGSEGIPQ